MDKNASEDESGLTFIQVDSENPFILFKKWLKEAKDATVIEPEAFTLATATREGKVSARTLLLRQIEKDGIIFMTDGRSKKSRELADNPTAAVVFKWAYFKDDVKYVRQVRFEGSVIQLERPQYQHLYDTQPFYCKVRAHCCHQGATVDWQDHKKNHDNIVREVKEEGRPLPMPDHFVAYKLEAEVMEFYFAENEIIGDRVIFVKASEENEWKHHNIAA